VAAVRIVDVTDGERFAQVPRCADPGFDHRTCDYWEDADRGSKAARLSWLEATPVRSPAPPEPEVPFNPFASSGATRPAFNPFTAGDDDDRLADNPFAPPPRERPRVPADAPRKLALLARGLAVFGSYAKVLLVDEAPAAYTQFGPLSAYPRATRLRDLYPQLPASPLPAVITCIATTAEARRQGHGRRLVGAVCDDLAGRGFAAVEAYPEIGAAEDATSAATPAFWISAGFSVAVDDERFPVMRKELG
jgi:GNAT superfamily N-acetyltransferase